MKASCLCEGGFKVSFQTGNVSVGMSFVPMLLKSHKTIALCHAMGMVSRFVEGPGFGGVYQKL